MPCVGSALLEQLRQATPREFDCSLLQPFQPAHHQEAEGPDALEQVNALALNLEALDDFRVDGTAVVKASANDKGLIDFSIESAFDPTVGRRQNVFATLVLKAWLVGMS